MPRVKTFDESEVLQKAVELFWKKGYCATSMQDLVNHLGINRASLYDTYGCKKELFTRAFEYYRSTNTAWIEDFFDKQPDVKEGLRLFFEKTVAESLKDKERKGCFVVNTSIELLPGDDEMLATLEKNKKALQKIFYNYLKKGEAEEQIPKGKDLRAIASMFFLFINGIRVVSKINPKQAELKNSVGLLLGMLE